MSIQAPAASARPDIISLDVLLNDVDEGRVQIPRFQRPYVWTPQMMRELFESVLSGYPIGSLLFWVPRDPSVPTMPKIGPLTLPARHQSEVSLVLDGHQRLATLYSVLKLPENFPRGDQASADQQAWWMGYDLVSQEPRQIRKVEEFANPTILHMRSLLRSAEFVKFVKALDTNTSISESNKLLYLDRADKVQRAIRDYRIALTIMRDGTVDDAVAIFSKINRSGRKMSADQMAVALTFRDGFNLEDALDEILGALEPFGFGDVSRSIVLQSLLHGAGRPFTKPNFSDLRKEETQTALQSSRSTTSTALERAAKFLNEDIGFSTGRLLPYALQLLLLGVFFRTQAVDPRGLDGKTISVLKRWFWATSFSGWFASANSAEVERAVKAMEAFASEPSRGDALKAFEAFFLDRPLRPFPKTFDRRSARIRALLLVQIASGQLLDPMTSAEINGSELISDPDRRDLPYVFPPNGTRQARSPANRILLDRSYGSAVRRTLLLYLENTDALASHGINSDGCAALSANMIDDFVAARELELQRQEANFLSQFNLEVAHDVKPSEEEFDVEEE